MRSIQPALVEQILEQLRLDFAAGHAHAERRVLIVDHGQPGRTDQDQLPFETKRIHLAVEHVDSRDEAARIPAGIVDAELAISLRGHAEVADRNRVDPGTVRNQANFAGAERDAQQLH